MEMCVEGLGEGTNGGWQRNLNNAFAYDLVPSPSVIIAALRAARRVNDFPTAVRIFEGKFKSLLPPSIINPPVEEADNATA